MDLGLQPGPDLADHLEAVCEVLPHAGDVGVADGLEEAEEYRDLRRPRWNRRPDLDLM